MNKYTFYFLKPSNAFMEAVEGVLYSYLALGLNSVSSKPSLRLFQFALGLNGALFFWAYCGGLVSYLTIEKYEQPIKSIEVIFICKKMFFQR